jgi:hypothetical protein
VAWIEAAAREAHGATLDAAPEPPPEAGSRGSKVPAEGGLLACREFDAALALSTTTAP